MMNKCDLNVCLPVFPPRRKTRLTFAMKMPFKELSEKQFPSIQVLTPVLGHPGLAGMLPPHSTEMTSHSRTERGKAHPKQQQGKLSPKALCPLLIHMPAPDRQTPGDFRNSSAGRELCLSIFLVTAGSTLHKGKSRISVGFS